MSSVKVHPQAPMAPSAQVVTQAASEVLVSDARGRTITMRKPNPITKLRFIDAMGESSTNRLWVSNIWALMFVTAVDGNPVPTPTNKNQIEALYQRLDDDGIVAVSEAFEQHFTEKTDVDEDLAKK
ncbi:hypothetical protein [Paraburkholderia sp. BL17N1]|uniref:hypothetical protein n=1 Tax=Paraburkholderia sp. BL17N1 TaxID=1938798 RepID=UPI000EB189CC|nr:hypothetical protein [Paraburkholderia sp. BL17N1]RKR46316.1 hypothetical protein B0G82_3999 [Paraburkholderia sp. BL17N1]